MDLNNFYTSALMEHNAHPDYKYELDDATCSHRGVNPSCGDDITLSLHVTDDGVIDEAAFTGSGCAVSQASADIMADLITDRTVEEAAHLCQLFIGMIRGDVTDDAQLSELGEAAQLQSIALMPARVKCAELAWRTCETMLSERAQQQDS